MLLSRSLPVQGLASVVGKAFDTCFKDGKNLPYSSHRFFEATAFALLTIFIQHFEVGPDPKFSGDSFEQLKERYSQGKTLITLT